MLHMHGMFVFFPVATLNSLFSLLSSMDFVFFLFLRIVARFLMELVQLVLNSVKQQAMFSLWRMLIRP